MKRRKPLKRTPLRRKLKDPKEWRRAYHSLERVYFVSVELHCCVPTCLTYIDSRLENHHWRTGGMGRKAAYTEIVPLCGHGSLNNHHAEVHRIGRQTFEERYKISLREKAAKTEDAWQTHGERLVARAKENGTYQRWLDA